MLGVFGLLILIGMLVPTPDKPVQAADFGIVQHTFIACIGADIRRAASLVE